MNLKSSSLVFLAIMVVISCELPSGRTIGITSAEKERKATKVSLSDLAKDYKSYHGQYIETTGYYTNEFERSTLSADKNASENGSESFWVTLDSRIVLEDSIRIDMNGKKMTIKGRVDTSNKGHLNGYLATIADVYLLSHR